MTYLTHLECSVCRAVHDHSAVQTVCTKCGRSLLARYDLQAARKRLSREVLLQRDFALWRFRELLPVLLPSNEISLGEGGTPVLPLVRICRLTEVRDLRIKDESFNATGSFKARGLCVAVAKARELGIQEACMPTAGNAGSALAAYGAAAGIRSHIYMPEDTPRVNIDECRIYGADVHLVPGVISDAAARMNAERGTSGWFDMSTLKEPYRLEGKKTLGFEIAEQYDWKLPDVIVYPTGGGTGLIGMWKAFAELETLGWIDGARPRMVAVQASGCAPVVKAFNEHSSSCEFWNNAATIASGLRVPKAFADHLILEALYESKGCAVTVSDAEIVATIKRIARIEGLLLCPEGAATIAALAQLREMALLNSASSVLCFNTGSGLKYSEVLRQASTEVS